MSSNVYTLPELVDRALQTPEVGAVNFNILRIVLRKILTECKLQNVTGEWEPIPHHIPVSQGLIQEEKLPDHPILTRIAEEKEREKAESAKSEEKVKSEVRLPTVSKDKAFEAPERVESRDTATTTQRTESPIVSEQPGKGEFSEIWGRVPYPVPFGATGEKTLNGAKTPLQI